jgi:hypothetical protein
MIQMSGMQNSNTNNSITKKLHKPAFVAFYAYVKGLFALPLEAFYRLPRFERVVELFPRHFKHLEKTLKYFGWRTSMIVG